MTVVEPSGPDQIPGRGRCGHGSRRAGLSPAQTRHDGSEGPAHADARLSPSARCASCANRHGAIIAYGLMMVEVALRATEHLARDGVEVTVVDMATIKPIDRR